MTAYVGTSGWVYDDWRGRFYPEDLPRSRWLSWYAKRLPSVEVNGTFYRLPSADTFRRWADAVPDTFRFALKMSRYATHVRRLRDPATVTRFAEASAPLGAHRGPWLVQTPAPFPPDPGRLDRFLAAVPPDVRVAFEPRDLRWCVDEVHAVLRRHDCALVWSDFPGAETPEIRTASFVYVRRHGTEGLYAGRYGRVRLLPLARRLADEPGYVYCYFNNDADAAAPADAMDLLSLLRSAEERA